MSNLLKEVAHDQYSLMLLRTEITGGVPCDFESWDTLVKAFEVAYNIGFPAWNEWTDIYTTLGVPQKVVPIKLAERMLEDLSMFIPCADEEAVFFGQYVQHTNDEGPAEAEPAPRF